MDIGLPVSVDVKNCHGLCAYKLESEIAVNEDLSVNKLGNDVSVCLNIQDDKDGVPGSNASCGKLGVDAITAKESTFSEDIKSTNPPAALKPVSAMKGSREKRGATPPQKLTVKWAPDVYDPVPTSVSHVVSNNKPQRESRSKKNSKSKQKNGNKSSRGNKYKDKKHNRKRGGGSSNVGFKFTSYEEEEEVVVDYGVPPPTANVDFHVGNPDQFCGSSFLKRYERNLHLSSLAEAT